MQDKIQKLYELAGIEEKRKYFVKDKLRGCYFVTNKDGVIKHFNNSIPSIRNRVVRVVKYYEKFTSQKQLELIKILAFKEIVIIHNWGNCFTIGHQNILSPAIKETESDFSQALAGLICNIWGTLTYEQQKEIKRILE